MLGPNTHNADSEATRRREAAHDGPVQASGSSIIAGTDIAALSRLVNSSSIGARYNAPMRATAMRGRQQTHGNRAVQRAVSTGGSGGSEGRVAVQRDTLGLAGPVYGPMLPPVYGPALAPTPAPIAEQDIYGQMGTMEDDVPQQSAAQGGSIEENEARAEAIREAMSVAYSDSDSGSGGDGYGDYVSLYDGPPDGGVCAIDDNVPNVGAAPAGSSSTDDSSSPIGDVNNALSAGTTAVKTLGDAALHGMRSPLIPEIGNSWIGNLASRLPGAENLAKMSDEFSFMGFGSKAMGALNNATSYLGVGMGTYNLLNADNNADRVQAGADTVASGAGLFGPVGRAFSGGYSAGQLLDKGADWVGDKIWGEGDHSLHHGIAEHVLPNIPGMPSPQTLRDTWEVFRGRGTEAQQENAENRKFEVELDHIKEARKEREQKAQDEAEMAEIRSQMAHPHIGGTMLGGPGDALSGRAIAEQFLPHDVDEDGVPLPPVSMALPTSRH